MRLLAIAAVVFLAVTPALADPCPDEMVILRLDKTPPTYPNPEQIMAGCTDQIEHPDPPLSAARQRIAYINRASFEVLAQQYEPALADLEKASHLQDNDPSGKEAREVVAGMSRAVYIDYVTGVVLARMGKKAEARSAFQSALDEADFAGLDAMQQFVRVGMKAELNE